MKNLEELKAIRERAKAEMAVRSEDFVPAPNGVRKHIMVCGGTGCTSSQSPKIIEAFEKELAARGLQDEIKVVRTGCFGLCARGPIVMIHPEGTCYTMVKPEDVP